MVISSAIFLLLFLPVVFILNFFCKKEYSNIFAAHCKFDILRMGRAIYGASDDCINYFKLGNWN